ncbi:MAG TPA: hypothetical protein DG753_09000 [Clostridium sp.]|nr:hypothetical protein [Clostridium sp.]
MRIFSPNFEKEGRGIEKGEKNEYNLFYFFKLLKEKFWTIIKLNFLFIIFSIPIITIPAALGALNSLTMRIVKREHIFIWSDFISKFKENWKQSTVCFLILTTFMIFSLFCLNLYFSISQINKLFLILFFITLTIIFFLIMVSLYVYPLLTTISLSTKDIIKNSALLSVVCIKNSLLGLIVFIFFILNFVAFFPFALPIALIIGFSLHSFINSFITFKCIDKYIAIN